MDIRSKNISIVGVSPRTITLGVMLARGDWKLKSICPWLEDVSVDESHWSYGSGASVAEARFARDCMRSVAGEYGDALASTLLLGCAAVASVYKAVEGAQIAILDGSTTELCRWSDREFSALAGLECVLVVGLDNASWRHAAANVVYVRALDGWPLVGESLCGWSCRLGQRQEWQWQYPVGASNQTCQIVSEEGQTQEIVDFPSVSVSMSEADRDTCQTCLTESKAALACGDRDYLVRLDGRHFALASAGIGPEDGAESEHAGRLALATARELLVALGGVCSGPFE